MLKKEESSLTLFEGIALAIGSIMGSGILFLPSLTLAQAGSDAILGWTMMTLLCLPGLFFLQEMSEHVSSSEGIAGFIGLGLGKRVSRTIPDLILGTVIIGMPSAAIIASRYMGHFSFAYIILALACTSHFFDFKTSAKTAQIVALLLVVVGIYLVYFSFPRLTDSPKIHFTYNLKNILNSCVLAFWAYAGFENLTFLAPRFKKNSHDLILSAFIAIIICGAIYIGLTYSLAHLKSIDTKLGLMQLADSIPPRAYCAKIIAGFAFLAVLINFISWIGGIKELLSVTLKPKQPLILLGALFFLSISLGLLFPHLFDSMLAIVSLNFLVLYLLCLVSYFSFAKNIYKKITVFIFVAIIAIALASYQWLLLYPIVIMLISSRRKNVA